MSEIEQADLRKLEKQLGGVFKKWVASARESYKTGNGLSCQCLDDGVYADIDEIFMTMAEKAGVVLDLEDGQSARLYAATALDSLRQQVAFICGHRGWPVDWPTRLAYLQLEAAELIEAHRGKRGDVLEEAADLLVTVLALFNTVEVDTLAVLQAADKKLLQLATSERTPGEYYVDKDEAT